MLAEGEGVDSIANRDGERGGAAQSNDGAGTTSEAARVLTLLTGQRCTLLCGGSLR